MGFSAVLAFAAMSQSVIQGEKQGRAQKRALHEQKQAQSRAIGAEKLSAMEMAKANKKKPDVSSLLGRERKGAIKGAGATMLTGPGGADSGGKMLLGRKSSLMGY